MTNCNCIRTVDQRTRTLSRQGLPLFLLATTVVLLMTLMPAVARADFGLEAGSVSAAAQKSDGTPITQASSHPYVYKVNFNLNTTPSGAPEGGELRDVIVDLPPGLIGNPLAVPRCARQSFEGNPAQCAPSTQVGVVRATLFGVGIVTGPLYNIAPPPGSAAQIGFSIVNINVIENAFLRSQEEGYGLRVGTFDLPIPITSATEEIWGVPADPSHDALRGLEAAQGQGKPVASDAPLLPFLTLPGSCSAPLETTVKVDSKLAPGIFSEQVISSLDSGGNPAPLTGCEAVPFSPKISTLPTSEAASSPSGVDFELKLPNQGLLGPSSIAETEPVRTDVTLPAGVTVNPSAANGIVGCTESQYEAANGEPGTGCPEASKIGTLLAKTPLLEEPIEGSVYLAAPHQNPFGSLLALYIVAEVPERGVLIKQAGEVQADPSTGQLTATFDGLPPLPYSSFEVDLRGGPRAPLITPQTCGTYTTVARLYPFSSPTTPVERTANVKVATGANGAACAASEAQLPHNPSLQAGAVTPLAGAFSPLVFKVSREDGSQHLSAITGTLPEGVLGKLAGVPYCSDAQIATALTRSREGEGAIEQASPSCPEASQVGVVNVTAGAGSQPYAVQGKAYLAGPYKNAPLSLAIITPAIAGPFDLGTVVVRAALYIDPSTAKITAVSDPIPTILYGIPLDVRSVSVNVNRAGFMFNPTNCEAMAVTGQAVSTLDQLAGLSSPFRVGGCQGLAFKPSLMASTASKASKANGASLTVKVAQKPGEADIHKVALTIPKQLPARLTTLQKACTEAQFNANPAACPAGSFIGTAKATTPILSVPLTGPAVLVSHGGAAFPDVVFLLQANERGSVIQIELDGKTDIKKGVTYSRFETLPDAPITSFETNLNQGPHSILGVYLPGGRNDSLCGQKLTIPTTITGQNGAQITQATPVGVTGCSSSVAISGHSVKGRDVTLSVAVPGAGRLTAIGKGLSTDSKTSHGRETVKVTLHERGSGKLSTHVDVTFTPSKGRRLRTSLPVKLRP